MKAAALNLKRECLFGQGSKAEAKVGGLVEEAESSLNKLYILPKGNFEKRC